MSLPPGPPAYNPLYEKLVDTTDPESHEELVGLVAYALYKRAKRNWAVEHVRIHGRTPAKEELDLYTQTWTEDRLEGLRTQAGSALAEFASFVTDAREPEILKQALRGSFWRAVWPAMTASFIYTLLLIAAVTIAYRSGIDLFEVIHKASGQ